MQRNKGYMISENKCRRVPGSLKGVEWMERWVSPDFSLTVSNQNLYLEVPSRLNPGKPNTLLISKADAAKLADVFKRYSEASDEGIEGQAG